MSAYGAPGAIAGAQGAASAPRRMLHACAAPASERAVTVTNQPSEPAMPRATLFSPQSAQLRARFSHERTRPSSDESAT